MMGREDSREFTHSRVVFLPSPASPQLFEFSIAVTSTIFGSFRVIIPPSSHKYIISANVLSDPDFRAFVGCEVCESQQHILSSQEVFSKGPGPEPEASEARERERERGNINIVQGMHSVAKERKSR